MKMTLRKIRSAIIIFSIFLTACGISKQAETRKNSLKDAFAEKFYIGAALNLRQITGYDTIGVKVVKQHFNAIVAENCMKSMYMQPFEGRFFFEEADQFVGFGERNGMFIVGHTLIWHSQIAPWFFVDQDGKDVAREVLIQRMKDHITTIVGRYKGRVNGWDVVNEAILDDGEYRKSKFYTIIGEDYIPLAFRFAHEADPDAELYYNDYSMASEGKRAGVVRMVKSLQEKGIRIDGIGMQGHSGFEYPDINEFEKSILAFSELVPAVMITEMDITTLPAPQWNAGADVALNYDYQQKMNPYAENLPDSITRLWEKRYIDFFRLFLKYQDKIKRVNLWGVSDSDSWLNDWPIVGRTDYPLLFDRNYKEKPVIRKIIDETYK